MSVLRTLAGLVVLLARRVRRAVAPVLGVVSPLGWIALGLALAVGIAGAVLGWAEFRYLALTLAAGPLVALLFLIGRGRFRVEVELSPRRVVAGQRAFGRMTVTNASGRRSTTTRLELPVGRGRAEFTIPPLEPGQEHEELFAVPTARRAVVVAGPAVSVRGDALGLVRREMRWSEPVELFVHPVTTRLSPSAAGLVRDLEGEVTQRVVSDDLAFHALRPYEPGDDRRHVHWRTTARTGRLMVRQFQETRRSQLAMLLTTERDAYDSADEFETAVSTTASIAAQVLREGTRVAVATERLTLRCATPTSMLDDASRLELGRSGVGLREFARTATRRMPPPAVLIVVVGSLVPVADLRGIESVFGPDTRIVAIRVADGEDARRSTVSRLRLLTLGALGDLPALLRSAA